MLYIAENLKILRKGKDLTQEEAAEMLGVSPQSVSKWERGDTYPDITLLPALANLYKISLDALIGMDKINEVEARTRIFTSGHECLQNGDGQAAATIFSDALKTFPNDEALMAELALVLSLETAPEKLRKAAELCERVLSGNPGEKVRHTTRAAICFIYYKLGEKEKAVAAAQNLPHLRESRENVLALFEGNPPDADIDAYLRFLALGGEDAQDVILVDFGIDMIATCEEYGLLDKINALREEVAAPTCNKEGRQKLPVIRIRDEAALPPGRVRLRYYADFLIDRDFTDASEATDEIILALRKISERDGVAK